MYIVQVGTLHKSRTDGIDKIINEVWQKTALKCFTKDSDLSDLVNIYINEKYNSLDEARHVASLLLDNHINSFVKSVD